MSKGAIIFAYDKAYAYTKMAAVAARLVKKHLGIPVTLVTDKEISDPAFDQVIIHKNIEPEQLREFDGELKPWANQNRSTVYHLSPYDQTLLIDADYFVMNDVLKSVFDTDLEFACYGTATSLDGYTVFEKTIGTNSIPMQWATVIYFTKNQLAESVFSFINYIKDHFEFYSLMYNFSNLNFRNDYALSIALQTLTGYQTNNFNSLPGELYTLPPAAAIIEVRPGNEILYTYPSGITRNMVVNKVRACSVHVLGKKQLFEHEILDQLLINA